MGARLRLPSLAGDVFVIPVQTDILSVEAGPHDCNSKGCANSLRKQGKGGGLGVCGGVFCLTVAR